MVAVSDVDRSKAFYTDRVGFNLDIDRDVGNGMRVVQMTPPGSACSVTSETGGGEPGTLKGLQLTVGDIAAARDLLAGRGLDITEVQVFEEGRRRATSDGDDFDYAALLRRAARARMGGLHGAPEMMAEWLGPRSHETPAATGRPANVSRRSTTRSSRHSATAARGS